MHTKRARRVCIIHYKHTICMCNVCVSVVVAYGFVMCSRSISEHARKMGCPPQCMFSELLRCAAFAAIRFDCADVAAQRRGHVWCVLCTRSGAFIFFPSFRVLFFFFSLPGIHGWTGALIQCTHVWQVAAPTNCPRGNRNEIYLKSGLDSFRSTELAGEFIYGMYVVGVLLCLLLNAYVCMFIC